MALTEERKRQLRQKAMQQAQAEEQAKNNAQMRQDFSGGQMNNGFEISREQQIYNQAYQDAQMNIQRQLYYQQQMAGQQNSVPPNVTNGNQNNHAISDPLIRLCVMMLVMVGLYFGVMYLANHSESSALVDVTLSNGTVVKGVHSDFKEMMDSYEAWATKYREFMDNMDLSDLSSVNAYNDMLKESQQWATKMQGYNKENLSEADYLYYFDVYSRVAKILFDTDKDEPSSESE